MWIVRDYRPSLREAAGGGLGIQGHPQLYGEFKARSKKTKKQKRNQKTNKSKRVVISDL